jgi:hypothetical protein
MLDLIEIELTRVRRMAEQAGDDFLLYLIDMAVIEAHARARSRRESSEATDPGPPNFDDLRLPRETTPDVQIVN